MGILAWLVGSRIGRYVASISVLAVLLALAALWLVNLGKRGERQRQQIENAMGSIAVMSKRIAVDAELSSMPIDARRERLRQWSTMHERMRGTREAGTDDT